MLYKLNAMELLSTHENFNPTSFTPKGTADFQHKLISTFFRPSFSEVLGKFLRFILEREFCHKNLLWQN